MQTEEWISDDLHHAAENMAQKINLSLSYEPADTRLYENLLKGVKHELITRVPKGSQIQINHFLD